MAIDINLPDIDQAAFDTAQAEIVQLIRENAPTLDIRRGTSLRDLLVRPAAQFHAVDTERINRLRQTYSLALMAANPTLADMDIAKALLANLAYFPRNGTRAVGYTAFYLAEAKDLYIPAGYIVQDGALHQYQTTTAWTARTGAVTDPATEVQLAAIDSALGKYFFVLPMTAAAVGAEYNAQANDALQAVSSPLANVTGLAVYTSFTGGSADETLQQSLAALPFSLSHRAFESEGSITAILFDRYNEVRAVRVAGYGNRAQLRDKHNLLGVAAGSKVDVYVRAYAAPVSLLLDKVGTKVSDGVYQFTITASEAPGFLRIRTVIPVGSFADGTTRATNPGVSSTFQLVRSGSGLPDTFHEIDPANAAVEAAYSVWQQGTVTVTNVPALIEGGVASYPATLPFTVELYVPPQLTAMQTLVDDDTLRNQEADQIVRGAIPCLVSLKATVYRRQSAVVDLVALGNSLADFINSKNFNDPLTISQLSAIFHSYDIVRVDLDDASTAGLQMVGSIEAPDGTLITLSGDRLDVSLAERPDLLISPDTVVFAADIRDIFLIESVISA
jgi:hypothetical protein